MVLQGFKVLFFTDKEQKAKFYPLHPLCKIMGLQSLVTQPQLKE